LNALFSLQNQGTAQAWCAVHTAGRHAASLVCEWLSCPRSTLKNRKKLERTPIRH
jgi:hypothetical protein